MSLAQQYRQQLAKTIKATATYYGRTLDPEVLSVMCDDLSDLDMGKCIDAYSNYRRNPRNRTFPLPAQIRELVNPEEFIDAQTLAREIASRIVGAIPKFGWCNAREAEAFIGEQGWSAVTRAGGWRYLCENTQAKSIGILQAQLRDQLEGSLQYGQANVEKAIGVGTRRDAPAELESGAEILKRLTAPEPEKPA